jgi:hypothetical protein
MDFVTNIKYKYEIGSWRELPYEVKLEWYTIKEYKNNKRIFPHTDTALNNYEKVYTNPSETRWEWVRIK